MTEVFQSAMEREIYQQPDIIQGLIYRYINPDNNIVIDIPKKEIKKLIFVASGSSYHCGVIASEMMKTSLGMDAEAFYSGEFYLSEKVDISKTLFVFISQSGETSDTLRVMKNIIERTDNILCISNTENSTMWNLAKHRINTFAGKEESIASTKALSAQLFCVNLMILAVRQLIGEDISKDMEKLKQLSEFLRKQLQYHDLIKQTASELKDYNSIEILGSRIFYGLAKEGALKIKETSYINTTAYPTGEFMHGHVAILNRKSAVIVLVDEINHGICIKNIEKIKESYDTNIITIADNNAPQYFNSLSNHHITTDTNEEIHSIFGTLILLQLLALECAKQLGRNIDKPTGLNKVVKY